MHEELMNSGFKKSIPKKEKASQAILFAYDKTTLLQQLPDILSSLHNDAVFWIAWPKKTGSIQSDLYRDDNWNEVFSFGWEGVTSASIDNDWTALRFRHVSMIKNMKRAVPMEERKTEGVDYINRTVTLPLDALNAMKPFKGLSAFFYTMAFTHKREYVEAIADAKKPETRQKRIDKMIEMVAKIQEQKELKNKK
jgi:hypothetical protein